MLSRQKTPALRIKKHKLRNKIKDWLRRYLTAEIIATISSVLLATAFFALTENKVIMAYAGALGEGLGFYAWIIGKDIVQSQNHHRQNGIKYGMKSLMKNLRNVIVEFGFAELLDSLIVRPALMYYFSIKIQNLQLAILIGKLSADVLFYLPTIISYELRKKYLKD